MRLREGVLKEQARARSHKATKICGGRRRAGIREGFALKMWDQKQSAKVSTGLADVQPERHSAEVELPTDPNHGRREFSFVPAHGHVQNLQENDQHGSQQRGGALFQQAQQIIIVDALSGSPARLGE